MGHTGLGELSPGPAAVHPHLRGAYIVQACALSPHSGSSPPTWGILHELGENQGQKRFIPTYVGHTFYALIWLYRNSGSSPPTWGIRAAGTDVFFVVLVHPHLRGAYLCTPHPRWSFPGSSPPTWGILPLVGPGRDGVRFIPTYVGHTYGEAPFYAILTGSSPPTWGILKASRPTGGTERFIPTYVGHTPVPPLRSRMYSVHPHLRGAYHHGQL